MRLEQLADLVGRFATRVGDPETAVAHELERIFVDGSNHQDIRHRGGNGTRRELGLVTIKYRMRASRRSSRETSTWMTLTARKLRDGVAYMPAPRDASTRMTLFARKLRHRVAHRSFFRDASTRVMLTPRTVR